MPRRLCEWRTLIPGKKTRVIRTVVGLLLGVLGLCTCMVGCAGPNPFVRARPPDALAWDEARRADSAYFYQRFLMQYPSSAFARLARIRLEALDWAIVQHVDGMPDYARFMQAYPDSARVPQAQTRLLELAEQGNGRQRTNERINCPQLQDRVRAYTAAVEQVLVDIARLAPDKRQRSLLSHTDLPHLPAVFHAIRDYRSTVAIVHATYGAIPSCHLPHKEIAYVALPTTDDYMLLRHIPVYGPLRGEQIWQILE